MAEVVPEVIPPVVVLLIVSEVRPLVSEALISRSAMVLVECCTCIVSDVL